MSIENQNSKYVDGLFSEIRTENRSNITSDFMINPNILLDVPSEPILAHYI